MSWVLEVLAHVIKALYLTVWGSVRAVLSVFPSGRQKRPDLSGKLCLVTGAGQGLGRQLALQMADCGASLVLWDIDEEKVALHFILARVYEASSILIGIGWITAVYICTHPLPHTHSLNER